jgi:hypothetical protein
LRIRIHFQVFIDKKCEDFTTLHAMRRYSTSNMKFLSLFSFLLGLFAFLDPDPDPESQLTPDPKGSG